MGLSDRSDWFGKGQSFESESLDVESQVIKCLH